MDRPKLNYIVDFFAFVSFLITAVTGLVIFVFLPSGVRQGRLQEFAGISKGTWGFLHDWAGILLIILVMVHLVLHREWIAGMTKNFFKAKRN